MLSVVCTGHAFPSRRTRVFHTHVKKAVQHAKNLCFNYEDTQECRAAWELVEELTEEMDRQEEEENYIMKNSRDDMNARKMYDH